jgi:hypothetical protein
MAVHLTKGWQDGDEIDDFDRSLVLFGARARQLGTMGDSRPAGLKIGTHLRTDLDGAPFNSPALSIDRLGLLELSKRIGKVGSQIDLECGFVAFDHKERIHLLRTQEVGDAGGESAAHQMYRPVRQWAGRKADHSVSRVCPEGLGWLPASRLGYADEPASAGALALLQSARTRRSTIQYMREGSFGNR